MRWHVTVSDGKCVTPGRRPTGDPAHDTGEVDCAARGDRAWLAGSLALSTPEIRGAYLSRAPEREIAGAPETDLRIRIK